MEYVQLNDGNKIPAIGFGVFMIPNDGPTYEAVAFSGLFVVHNLQGSNIFQFRNCIKITYSFGLII